MFLNFSFFICEDEGNKVWGIQFFWTQECVAKFINSYNFSVGLGF